MPKILQIQRFLMFMRNNNEKLSINVKSIASKFGK